MRDHKKFKDFIELKPSSISLKPLALSLFPTMFGLLAAFAAIAVLGDQPATQTLPPKLATTDGAVMLWVPAGLYKVGDDDGPENSRPLHEVQTPIFYMDQYEVTNEQYLNFCIRTGHAAPPQIKGMKVPKGRENYPVVNVSYRDAEDYARWAKKQLPTEDEWEVAARGKDAFIYPWGNKLKPLSAIRRASPLPVGSKKGDVSPFGISDMAGNVMEWTRDHYGSYPGAKKYFESAPERRVVRGAGFKSGASDCKLFIRRDYDKSFISPQIGFRCVREIYYKK